MRLAIKQDDLEKTKTKERDLKMVYNPEDKNDLLNEDEMLLSL